MDSYSKCAKHFKYLSQLQAIHGISMIYYFEYKNRSSGLKHSYVAHTDGIMNALTIISTEDSIDMLDPQSL